MRILFVAIIFFFLAFSIKELLKFKMEHSLFLSVCSVIIILFFSGIAGSLAVGYYLIVALSVLGFILSTILLIVDKNRSFSLKDIFTPGIVVFVLASTIYFVFMRGNIMAITDAAVHWGYATKWMHETGDIYVGVQTLGVPLLNYFIIRTAGYSESLFFVGRWIFMWSALILPLADVKWNNWYKALIYAVMAYMVLGVIDPEPKLFMDLPLGVFAGSLCAMLAVSNDKTKSTITAAVGVVVLGNIKNGSGLLLSVFVSGFAVLMYFASYRNSESKKPYYLSLFVPALVLAEIFRRLTHQSNIKDNAEPGMVIPLDGQLIFSKIAQTTTIVLFIAFIAALVVYIYLYRRKKSNREVPKNLYKISLIFMIIFAALTVYKGYSGFFSALTHKDQVILIKYWQAYNIKGYYGFQIRNLLGILAAFTVICAVTCLKKEYVKGFIAQTSYMVISLFLYSFAIIITYLHSFIEMEAAGYAAMHRYVGSSIVFISVWLIGLIVLNDRIWTQGKRQLIASFVLLAFLSRETPAIGTVYNHGLQGEAGVHLSVMDEAEYIKSYTESDSKIYFISQDYDKATYLDSWSSNAWIRYEIAPRYLNWVFWSLGDSFNDVDPSTINIDSEGFKDILLSQGYDYVYLFDADDYFWDNYGNLFADGTKGGENVLYRVTSAEDYLFEPVN